MGGILFLGGRAPRAMPPSAARVSHMCGPCPDIPPMCPWLVAGTWAACRHMGRVCATRERHVEAQPEARRGRRGGRRRRGARKAWKLGKARRARGAPSLRLGARRGAPDPEVRRGAQGPARAEAIEAGGAEARRGAPARRAEAPLRRCAPGKSAPSPGETPRLPAAERGLVVAKPRGAVSSRSSGRCDIGTTRKQGSETRNMHCGGNASTCWGGAAKPKPAPYRAT